MSTPVGQSLEQALQARQRSSDSRTSSDFQPSSTVRAPRTISCSTRARPRVEHRGLGRPGYLLTHVIGSGHEAVPAVAVSPSSWNFGPPRSWIQLPAETEAGCLNAGQSLDMRHTFLAIRIYEQAQQGLGVTCPLETVNSLQYWWPEPRSWLIQ